MVEFVLFFVFYQLVNIQKSLLIDIVAAVYQIIFLLYVTNSA